MNYRILSLDEIKEREQALWHSEPTWQMNYRPSADLQRRMRRQVYEPAKAISYGFAPLVYDRPGDWLYSHRAMCLRCGHVVATRQPSWMRKHNTTKHGDPYRSPSFSELLYPQREE